MTDKTYFTIYKKLDKDIAGISAGIPIGLIVNFFSSSFNVFYLLAGLSTLLTLLIMLKLINLKNSIKEFFDQKTRISDTLLKEGRITQPHSPETCFVNALNFEPKNHFRRKLVWFPIAGLVMTVLSIVLLICGHNRDKQTADNDEFSLANLNRIEHRKNNMLIKDSTKLADSVHYLNQKLASQVKTPVVSIHHLKKHE